MAFFARSISATGHPLLIGIIYVIFISFSRLPSSTALLITGLMIGIVILPIIVHNLVKLRNGTYSNFDVSNQQQRKGFYPFAISLFALVLTFFYFFSLPKEILIHTFLFLLLLISMAIFNFKIKASLHSAVAFHIAMKIFDFGVFPGILMLLLAIMVAWSRWVLNKHAVNELILGAAMGIAFGGISLWATS